MATWLWCFGEWLADFTLLAAGGLYAELALVVLASAASGADDEDGAAFAAARGVRGHGLRGALL